MATLDVKAVDLEMSHTLIVYDGEADNDREWYESDLQLAAELGKTLLERNHELENSLRQQQMIIEEQAQEIAYLARQTAALREVNDSRLKVYEQLEMSIVELEKTNEQLQHESSVDKERIKSLCNSVDTLEKKCEDLQELVKDLRNLSEGQKPKEDRPTKELWRTVSCEALTPENDYIACEFNPWEIEAAKLRGTVSRLKCQLAREQRQKEDLEVEINLLIQENTTTQKQLQTYSEKRRDASGLQSEVEESEEKMENICQSCHMSMKKDDVSSVLGSDTETEEPFHSGECALVQLKNGGVAYGSQESLQSVGSIVLPEQASTWMKNSASLLSELDAQYRSLIEKYEALVSVRSYNTSEENHQATSQNEEKNKCDNNSQDLQECAPEERENLGVESPEFFHPRTYLQNSKSVTEMSEAGESSLSSGFSEMSENGFIEQGTQTDITGDFEIINRRTLILSSSDPLAGHFNRGPPEYKQLFQEIFAVLKRSLREDEIESSVLEDNRGSVQNTKSYKGARRKKFTSFPSNSERMYHASNTGDIPKPWPTSGSRRGKERLIPHMNDLKTGPLQRQSGPVEIPRARPPGALTYAEVVRRLRDSTPGTPGKK